MNIGILGCGFVADQYMSTLAQCKELPLIGAYDQSSDRTKAFSTHYGVQGYESLEAMLADERIELVLNLTNPRSHYETNRACLLAGKHVYSEKPLAMDVASATALADLAEEKGLYLASAPCNVLGRTAQTAWKAMEDGAIGKPLLVYAAFEAGMIAPHAAPWNWKSRTGAHWPAKDEFEIGCTFEHAGYLLTCLLAMFGPVKTVTAFSSTIVKNKGIDVDHMAPDFTVGCLEFENSDVVARVTCGIAAPREKTFMVVGEDGVLNVDTFRDDTASIYVRKHRKGQALSPVETAAEEVRTVLRRTAPVVPWGGQPMFFRRRYPFATPSPARVVNRKKRVDFSLGPLELAAAIQEGRPCRLDGRVGVHVVELINALQYPDQSQAKQPIVTRFKPIAPLTWR